MVLKSKVRKSAFLSHGKGREGGLREREKRESKRNCVGEKERERERKGECGRERVKMI